MTKEEAIHFANCLKNNYTIDLNDMQAFCDIVIKSLEQEPVIDKIRAEIEQLPTKTRINWDGCCPDIDYPEIEYVDVTKAKLLEIIDKYKAKNEEKE